MSQARGRSTASNTAFCVNGSDGTAACATAATSADARTAVISPARPSTHSAYCEASLLPSPRVSPRQGGTMSTTASHGAGRVEVEVDDAVRALDAIEHIV